MRLNRLFILLVFVLGVALPAHSQFKFSSDPTQFVADVNAMFTTANNPQGLTAANAFTTAWGTFTPEQQKKIIELSQKLSKSKKLRVNPQFTDYFALLAAVKTKNYDNANIDTLLIMTDKIVDEYDGRQLQSYFSTLRLVVEEGIIFKSAYSRLRVNGGNIRFRWATAGPAPGELPDNYFEQQDTATAIPDEDAYTEENWDATWDEVTTEPEELPMEDIIDVGYMAPLQPPVSGAVIYFENADFTFITPYDSTTLKGTSGSLMLKTLRYVGKGGKVDWSNAGMPQVYAELAEYNFASSSYKFTSEGAKLYYPERSDSLVEGVFELNSTKHKTPADNPFPRFRSFGSNVEVKGLDENIIYKGGLSLTGAKLNSSSVDEGYATIEIQHDGKTRVKAISNSFFLGDSVITGKYTGLIIYTGDKDSIYHRGVVMKYDKSRHFLRATKQEGYRRAPFIDTYHDIEIDADAIEWNIDSTRINFLITNARCEIAAEFRSTNYFEANDYSRLQGAYRFHPLQVVVNYADKSKTNQFTCRDVADAYKIQESSLRGAMYEMSKLGYVDYNAKTGEIKLLEKGRFIVRARQKYRDYDNIIFHSLCQSQECLGGSKDSTVLRNECKGNVNASLNLANNDLEVHGVRSMLISDSLQVNIEPDSGKVIIKQNRDFTYNGALNTANFRFKGRDFRFDYDSFLVSMPTIDSIMIRAKPDTSEGGKAKPKVLGNELRYSAGTMYLNKPWNKSAKKSMPEYPMFDATSGATVLFNKKSIAGGAYDTTLQFKIPPFLIDSLSTSNPAAVGFDGEFVSGGIFPPFKERLVVMPDYSLGFTHPAPEAGFPLYEGKGKFYKKVIMDSKGLRGDGSIDYLNTTLYSNDFRFFSDSVLTVGTNGETRPGPNPQIEQTVTFPDVFFTKYYLKWLPKSDSMMISNADSPFSLYDSTATMIGTQVVSEKGLYGMGVIFTRGSVTESKNYHFEKTRYGAREAKFTVNSDNPDKPAFRSDKVKMEFKLDEGIAEFSPEQKGFASNEFPYAQYKSSLDNGVWDLHKRTVSMSTPDTSNLSSSYFYSTRKDQDSLVFNAAGAVYDMDKLTLNVYGIPFIKVSDAKIYPDSHKVFIQENAVIRTLNNAYLVMDTVKEYHYLYDANIDILGRNKFTGEALYRYVNLGSDTLKIRFQNFKYQESERRKDGAHTIATGMITEEDQIFLGPKILYRGKVTMYANTKPLVFDGYIRLDLKGAMSQSSQWLRYINNGESETVTIDLSTATAANGTPLVSGLHYDKQSLNIYPTFISTRQRADDKDLVVSTGILQYNDSLNTFSVGDTLKLNGKAYKGNFVSYDDNNSQVTIGGNLHLQTDGNTNVTLVSPGIGSGDLVNEEYEFNAMLVLTYKMHASISSSIALNIKAFALPDSSLNERDFNQRSQLTLQKLAEVIGDDGAKDYLSKNKLSYTPLPMMSGDFAKAIVIDEVRLKWSKVYKAYYSVGKFHVSNILKEDINKWMNGYIEIRKTGKGDIINIYLEATPDNWYFITYEENRLGVVCANGEINAIVAGKSKGEMADRTKFFFVQSEHMEKARFEQMFKENYLGDTTVAQPADELSPEDEPSPENENSPENEPTIDDVTNPQEAPPQQQPRGKNKKQDPNYDQYQMPEPQGDPSEDPQPDKGAENNLQQQQQNQKDQQQMEDLFK